MKKLFLIGSMLALGGFLFATDVKAQMISSDIARHTQEEEVEGKEIWKKLQAQEVLCKDLSDDDFEALGEYYMGQMMGGAHAAMNEMMMRVHGEEGEEAIHLVMGKRLSGCDPEAVFPAGSGGWMPMMQWMWSARGSGMMSWGSGFGFGSFGGGLLFSLIWWVLVIVGLFTVVKWLFKKVKE